MFEKVLVNNRGEIANRIFSACRTLGITAVAVYSEADAGAAWVTAADEAYPLPGKTAAESYLNQRAVIDIASRVGVDAIHPGYGFLSENADFAQACAAAGIVFIGPSPAAIAAMGSKARAREIAVEAAVPVTPGIDGADLSDEELMEQADVIGYPVLIKASAGGGGKGMRVVNAPADFIDELGNARSEARSSFGDDRVILERFFTEIHHVEVQILADNHGKVVHLFERECSIQRRHQKIIEESPSPLMTAELRDAMTSAAVRLAANVSYSNAGTVEFIVTADRQFYFLEMNTRLQVEHPITELVTGVDLGQLQIRIAAGEPLPFDQAQLQLHGHAIECRVYAEDPAAGFLPSIGRIQAYRPPSGPGVRVDDGIASGSEVTTYYDPMLAKIAVHGRNRAEAINRMEAALRDTTLLGITSNIPYLLDILAHPRFRQGNTPTNFLQQMLPDWQPQITLDDTLLVAVAAAELLGGQTRSNGSGHQAGPAQPDPWQTVRGWRNVQV